MRCRVNRLSVGRVWQHAQMPATPTVGLGSVGRRSHQGTTVCTAHGIGETRAKATDRCGQILAFAAFAHRIGQCDEVVIVRMCRQRASVANQLPAARRSDAASVQDA